MPETHFSFCGVDVDINLLRGAFQVDDGQGVSALHQSGLVTSPYGLEERSGGDGTLVDQDVDVVAFAASDVRRADVATPAFVAGSVLIVWWPYQSHQFGCLCAHDVVKSVEHVVRSGNVEQRSSLGLQMKSTTGVCQGVVNHNIDNTRCFGLGPTLKGEACRRVLKQVFHGNRCTVCHAKRLHIGLHAVFHHDACALFSLGFARYLQSGDHADACQCFTSEPQRDNG